MWRSFLFNFAAFRTVNRRNRKNAMLLSHCLLLFVFHWSNLPVGRTDFIITPIRDEEKNFSSIALIAVGCTLCTVIVRLLLMWSISTSMGSRSHFHRHIHTHTKIISTKQIKANVLKSFVIVLFFLFSSPVFLFLIVTSRSLENNKITCSHNLIEEWFEPILSSYH